MNTNGKVLVARLYEKTSANGNRYFAGRLGAARLAMFLDKRAEGTDPCWELFVQDGDGKTATPTPSREVPVNPGPRKRRKELTDPVKAAIGWTIPDDPLGWTIPDDPL